MKNIYETFFKYTVFFTTMQQLPICTYFDKCCIVVKNTVYYHLWHPKIIERFCEKRFHRAFMREEMSL